jgi:hypothetical protein
MVVTLDGQRLRLAAGNSGGSPPPKRNSRAAATRGLDGKVVAVPAAAALGLSVDIHAGRVHGSKCTGVGAGMHSCQAGVQVGYA